jgi:predicted NACHT family NTPase
MPEYNWKRFWCHRGGKINLSTDGYLYDPDGQWGNAYNPDVVSIDTISTNPCLILLGEPGIGKSNAIKKEWMDIEANAQNGGYGTLYINLNAYSSEDRLVRNIFESQKFRQWSEGDYNLYLFLDSLDECLLRIDTLAQLLVNEFNNYAGKLERLYLRITCRTAEWPNSLEKGLVSLWKKDNVRVYEMAPLRRIDVAEAAITNHLDVEKFLDEIHKKALVPFAIKPITLKFLINTFKKNKLLPSAQENLYYEGCMLLCEENNEERRETRLAVNIDSEQKLAIASRIAAITVFTNRNTIWTNLDYGDVGNEDIILKDLYGGKEYTNGNDFEVSETDIKEVLKTGLFSSYGLNRMGWVHKTYAEFLAAHYLVKHQVTLQQIMDLITHPEEGRIKLKPLAEAKFENDPDDELKWSVIRALWPNYMTTKSLFSILTPPKKENFLGGYKLFIFGDLVKNLNPEDLPVALKWVETLDDKHISSHYHIQQIMKKVMEFQENRLML